MPQNEVTRAVRHVRDALGLTQQEFASRLGMAISSVVRYELSRPPKGKVLARFRRFAQEHGLDEYADVFRHALAIELDMKVRELTPTRRRVSAEITCNNSDEEYWVHALLTVLRRPEHAAKAQVVRKELQELHDETAHAVYLGERSIDAEHAIRRLLDRGESPEQIAEKYPHYDIPSLIKSWEK